MVFLWHYRDRHFIFSVTCVVCQAIPAIVCFCSCCSGLDCRFVLNPNFTLMLIVIFDVYFMPLFNDVIDQCPDLVFLIFQPEVVGLFLWHYRDKHCKCSSVWFGVCSCF